MNSKRVLILGSTGSIGKSTIDVVEAHPDRYRVVGLSAHRSAEVLAKQAERFPGVMTALSGAADSAGPGDYNGPGAIEELIRSVEPDVVVNGISGAAGLLPSISALEEGADLALANKETVIMAGRLVRSLAEARGCAILPVDSEHSALFHLLRMLPPETVTQFTLTASGGAFRDRPVEELADVTVRDALAHPTWDMGAKITIDSATMANKAMEVIEAALLFDVPISAIDVLIHPQSRVHGMVRTADGSLYAQISDPDMRVPIQNALSYPEVVECRFGGIDLCDCTLSFSRPDALKYPLLEAGIRAGELEGAYPIAFNAGNEVAVEAFLGGRIGYTDIARVVHRCLEADWAFLVRSFDQVFELDEKARSLARETIRTIL